LQLKNKELEMKVKKLESELKKMDINQMTLEELNKMKAQIKALIVCFFAIVKQIHHKIVSFL
jgi:hypothetical protein